MTYVCVNTLVSILVEVRSFLQINGLVSRSTSECDASKMSEPANLHVLTPPQCFIAFLT